MLQNQIFENKDEMKAYVTDKIYLYAQLLAIYLRISFKG